MESVKFGNYMFNVKSEENIKYIERIESESGAICYFAFVVGHGSTAERQYNPPKWGRQEFDALWRSVQRGVIPKG